VVDGFEAKAKALCGSGVQALRRPLTQTPLGVVDGFEAKPYCGSGAQTLRTLLTQNSLGVW